MMLSRSAAKERFDTGHPVQLRSSRSGYAPFGWNSAALRHFGLKTFEEFEAAARDRLRDGGGTWHGAPPSRKTLDIAAGHIFRRQPFKIGNLDGTYAFVPLETLGDLPAQYHEDFQRADYAVWSYETPIAWVSTSGIVCVPPVRYSITTTQHQHLVARALGLDGFISSESAREGKGKTPYTKGWQSR